MATVVGLRKMEGVSKKTNRPYSGYILYCLEDTVPGDVSGQIAFEKFVSADMVSAPPYVGANVDFRFDFKGFLTGVVIQ